MATGTEIEILPALSDNYIYAIETPDGRTVVVDPGEAGPVLRYLEGNERSLDAIWLTHRHHDHIGGVGELVEAYGCRVVGPAAEADAIGGLDEEVKEGDTVEDCGLRAEVIATPGHTKGHVSFYLPDAKALFCGDTLFVMGCGRLFEGDAATMWESLGKLASLPEGTRVYCGHEYTLSNAKFAGRVDGANQAGTTKARLVASLREHDQPTVPTTIGDERQTNPFLRADTPELRRAVNMPDAPAYEVFGALRKMKDKG